MVFFSTKRVLSAISNDYWENRHCLTNGMTAQKFIFTLGMEKSRVLDKGKYADKIMEVKENWRKVEKIPDNSYIIRDSDYCVSFLFWRCRLLSREDFF